MCLKNDVASVADIPDRCRSNIDFAHENSVSAQRRPCLTGYRHRTVNKIYLVMDYMKRRDLGELVKSRGSLTDLEVWHLSQQIMVILL
jgi:serine/threonine protein kinase